MTQRGYVTEVCGDIATVSVKRQSACDTCRNKGNGCSHCDGGGTVSAKAKNSISAKVGDTVEVGASTGYILLAAFALFVFPIILAFAGYYIGVLIMHYATDHDAAEIIKYVLSVMFFIAAYCIVYLAQKKLGGKCNLTVTRIIKDQ